MQFRTTGLLLLGAMALPASGTAQTTPAAPAITRTVIAATKLPIVTDVAVHFKVISITLQPDDKSSVSAANGILYQMSGSTEVALDGEAKMLVPLNQTGDVAAGGHGHLQVGHALGRVEIFSNLSSTRLDGFLNRNRANHKRTMANARHDSASVHRGPTTSQHTVCCGVEPRWCD